MNHDKDLDTLLKEAQLTWAQVTVCPYVAPKPRMTQGWWFSPRPGAPWQRLTWFGALLCDVMLKEGERICHVM